MGQEIEIKLEAPNEAVLEQAMQAARRAAVKAGPVQTLAMHTQYYDTPARALGTRRWMLRTRQEGEDRVVTCKTPGQDALSRDEWNLARLDSGAPSRQELAALIAQGAPEELAQLGPWIPVCSARFTRRCFRLWLADGAELELAADMGLLCGTQEQAPLCELELELYGGSRGGMEVLAEELARACGLTPQLRSKFARARALR